jgi:hypothetical protein
MRRHEKEVWLKPAPILISKSDWLLSAAVHQKNSTTMGATIPTRMSHSTKILPTTPARTRWNCSMNSRPHVNFR